MPRDRLHVEDGPALRWLRATAASPPRYFAMIVVLAGLYILCAKLGLRLALVNPSATAVWAPAGISFAAFLLLGVRAAPAILVGAFVSNVTTSGTVLTSALIALGNTAEGLVGAVLVRRFAGGTRVFERAPSILRFVVYSALFSSAVSATVGVGTLAAAGMARLQDAGGVWVTWWLGDAVGDVVAAPVIVLLFTGPGTLWSGGRAGEAVLLAAVLAAGGWAIFHPVGGDLLAFQFLCIPPLLWAAFRFEPREAALAPLLLAAVVVVSAVDLAQAHRSLSAGEVNRLLLELQAFVGVGGVTTIAVAAVVSEQRALTARLQQDASELQGKVEAAGEALAGTAAEAWLSAGLLARSEQVARTGSFRWDTVSNRVTWSEELCRIAGRRRSELKGTWEELLEFVHPGDRHRTRALVASSVKRGRAYRVLTRIVRPDGESRWLDLTGEASEDSSGRLQIYGVCRDVTGERQEEARLQGLLESAPDAMVVVDRRGTIVMVNGQAQRLSGYSRGELLGHAVELLVPERFHPRHVGHREGYFAAPSTRPMGAGLELYVRRRDGSELPAEISLSPLETPEGVLVTAAIRDITLRRQAEASIRQLSHRLLQVQDEEQQRLASELQSGVARTLDLVRAELTVVRESGTVFDWKTADALRHSLDLARQAVTEVRTLSHMLYPRLLEEAGVVEAIRYFQGGFQERTGIKVYLDLPGKFRRLPPVAERTLFRVVQECLGNVQRHSQASTAWVSLRREPFQVVLEVRDNGRGIQPAAGGTEGQGFGIRMLSERMRQLDGRLEVESSPTGTRISATLPVSTQ